VIAAAAGLVLSPDASALGNPMPLPASKLDAVASWVARNGATTVPGMPSCTNVCNDLWLSEHRPLPGQVSSKDMWKELGQLETKVGVWPRIGQALGTAGLVFGAFTGGMTIGDLANRKWLHIGLNAPVAVPGPPGDPYQRRWQTTDVIKLSYLAAGASMPESTFSSGTPFPVLDPANDVLYLRDTTTKPGCNSGPCTVSQMNGPQLPQAGQSCDEQATFFVDALYAGIPIAPNGGTSCMSGPGPSCNSPNTLCVSQEAIVQYVLPEQLQQDAPHDYNSAADGTPMVSGPSTWSGAPTDQATLKARVQAELQTNSARYPNVLDAINTWTEEPAGMVTVPDCANLTLQQCLAALETAGFKGTHHTVTLDWSGAWVSRPPSTVVYTSPQRGAHIDATTGDIVITRNPTPDLMPAVVPDIAPGTSQRDAEQLLTDVGLRPVFVTAPSPDPSAGPSSTTHTPLSPPPYTKIAQGTTVTVELNPDTAPVPAAAGSCVHTSIRSLDLGPLKISAAGTFPFGVFSWIHGALGGFVAGGVAPRVDIPMPGSIPPLTIDLARFSSLMAYIHPVILLCSFLLLGWWLATAALGLSGGKDDD
jgi:hypothetical protein